MKKQILLSITISFLFIYSIHLCSFAQESNTMRDTMRMLALRAADNGCAAPAFSAGDAPFLPGFPAAYG